MCPDIIHYFNIIFHKIYECFVRNINFIWRQTTIFGFKATNRMIVLSTLRSAANLKTKNFIIIFSTYVPSPELMYWCLFTLLYCTPCTLLLYLVHMYPVQSQEDNYVLLVVYSAVLFTLALSCPLGGFLCHWFRKGRL